MSSSNSSSSHNFKDTSLTCADKPTPEMEVIQFLQMAIKSLLLTLLWIPAYAYRYIVVAFVKKSKPSFGKVFDFADSCEVEDYSDQVPSNSLVFTLVLEGSIQLTEFKELFTKNVLQAKISDKKTGKDRLRYPELQQHETEFGGYPFWKDDENFNLAHHITEKPFSENFASMSKFHQEMMNKTFPERRSPWDMTLVRNYQNDPDKTLIVLHCHHTLGDTLSWTKLLVASLGQKSLKMPNAQHLYNSFLDKIQYYALLPFYFVYVQLLAKLTTLRCNQHHWNQAWEKNGQNSKYNVSITNRIPLTDIKTIAKRNNVTTSAVIMAGVLGGVAKCDEKLAKTATPIRWVLPKMGHPDVFANHLYGRVMDLPTNLTMPLERLPKCNEIFSEMKSFNLHEYVETVMFQDGTWFTPIRYKFSVPPTRSPLIITNIASDREGFQVGEASCSDFIFTSGAYRTTICPFSYKDWMVVSATTRDSILSNRQTHQLTELIEKEFAILKDATGQSNNF